MALTVKVEGSVHAICLCKVSWSSLQPSESLVWQLRRPTQRSAETANSARAGAQGTVASVPRPTWAGRTLLYQREILVKRRRRRQRAAALLDDDVSGTSAFTPLRQGMIYAQYLIAIGWISKLSFCRPRFPLLAAVGLPFSTVRRNTTSYLLSALQQ